MSTHVCLVSAQPTPNLTPLIDRRLRPQRVVLVVSPRMERRASWLEQVIRARGISVERWPLDDTYDVEHIQARIMALLEQERELIVLKKILLNATGGTKLMSIAAYEVFRAHALPIFYVQPDSDRLVWLYPEGQAAIDLADRIKIEPFLQAHGTVVAGKPGRNIPDPALLQTGEQIVMAIHRFAKPLATLNWLAATASNRNLESEHLGKKQDKGALAALIDLFQRNGFLRRRKGRLVFASEEARFFANGGWLEYLVFDTVRKLRKEDDSIQDIAHSIDIRRESQRTGIPNELDVAFLRNNRFHLIECKTKRFSGKGADSPGAEALYKLDFLSDWIGGIHARAMLVSFQPLPEHVIRRAREMRIATCSGKQLLQLSQHIRNFISADS